MTKGKILSELTPSTDSSFNTDRVAASVFTDDSGRAVHAALYVGRDDERSIFHFDAETLREDKFEKCRPFLSKEFTSIPPFEAGAFLVHCREAITNPAPGYNFFYDGSYFKDGKFVGINGEPSYHMTCVGFCLGLLKGWFEGDEYIQYRDWNANTTLGQETINKELARLKFLYPKFTDDELMENIRRIKPTEYLASAYIEIMPIRKETISAIVIHLTPLIKNWHTSLNPA